MSRWFRFYDCALDDPKVQRLPCDAFRAWVNFLCLASRNDGNVSCNVSDIAFAFRVTDDEAKRLIGVLVDAGLIDETKHALTPHNWDERQFKSDTSTDRVKRFRERSRNVTVTPPEQNRTETETDNKIPRRKRAACEFDSEFNEFWEAYPRRPGNPKEPARKKFSAYRAEGIPQSEIMAGVRAYAASVAGKDPQFTAQAMTWLNQRRWKDDYASVQNNVLPISMEAQQRRIREEYARKHGIAI